MNVAKKLGLNSNDLQWCALFFAIWRVGLFLLGSIANFFLAYKPTFPYVHELLVSTGLPQWLYSWGNFDGVHYITIAEHGYVGTGLIQAFFPLLPYVLLHIPYVLVGSFPILLVGLVLTNFFGVLFLFSWFALLKLEFGEKTAKWGSAILFLFPTAFFFGALYTESLFLFLTVIAFLCARKKYWFHAAFFAGFAMTTRVVGVLLLPALMLELFLQYREQFPKYSLRNFFITQKKQLGFLLFSPLGLVIFMWFLFQEFHDPLYFLHVQSEFGAGRTEGITLYPQVVWRALKILFTARPMDFRYLIYIQEAVSGILGLIGIFLSLKYIRPSYVLFSLMAFLVPTFTGTFSSMSRYLLVSFSLWMLLGVVFAKYEKIGWMWLLGSTIVLIFNTILYIQGYWVA